MKLKNSTIFLLIAAPAFLCIINGLLISLLSFETDIPPKQTHYQKSFINISPETKYCLEVSIKYNNPSEAVIQKLGPFGENSYDKQPCFYWSLKENNSVVLQSNYNKNNPPTSCKNSLNCKNWVHTCSIPCTYYSYCFDVKPFKRYTLDFNLINSPTHTKNDINVLELKLDRSLGDSHLGAFLISILWLLILSPFLIYTEHIRWLELRSGTVPRKSLPGLHYQSVPGHGHCLFSAVALSLNQHPEFLRDIIAEHIKHHMEQYRYIIQAIDPQKTPEEYLQAVQQGIEWADNVEIAVLMKALNQPIAVVGVDGKVINLSNLTGSGDPIFVQYNGHDHYDALILTGEKSHKEILEALT